MKVRKFKKLVAGVGINDADYQLNTRDENGEIIYCPFYRKWLSMINRCYTNSSSKRYKSYEDCIVCDSWLYFSNFKRWMEQQDWEGKDLDKDLFRGFTKIYSEESCTFVTRDVNSSLLLSDNSRGSLPVGVDLHKGKYRARCSEGRGGRIDLGYYKTKELAHAAWQRQKIKYLTSLMEEQRCERTKSGLQRVINLITSHLSNGVITQNFYS